MSQVIDTSATRRPDGTHRVVITGMGAVTPAGVGVDVLWDAVMGKRCCIDTISHFDHEAFDVHVAGEVRDFDPTEHGLSKKEARRFERFVQYAIVAADEAMAQSGIDMEQEDPTRAAVIFGAGIGGIDELQNGFYTLHDKGPKRVSPLFVPTMIGNIAAGHLAIRYGMRGECIDVTTACATGAHNIGAAVRSIRHGYADMALAGGSEESVGAVVLESLEHALARGAKPLAEITGFGSTGDAYHMTAPEPSGEGIQRAMLQALSEGGFTPADLGHVNAHGTATPANDSTESHALLALCGEEEGRKVPVVSVKGTTGHTLGAAGAVEAIVTALSVANECVPPTTGFAQPDPDCPVNVLTEVKIGYPQKVALSNSLGFGGHNAVLAISPF